MLPQRLGERFTVRSAEAVGIRPDRYSAADLHRPFHGVRSLEEPKTLQDYLDCCKLRLKPGQRFGGTTAARHYGLPVPTIWKSSELLEVMVPTTGAPPRTRGVQGRRLRADRAVTMVLNGVPVVDAVAALFTCATTLTVEQAVVMIDALVTEASNYPGLGPGRPMSTLEAIARRLEEWGRFPGCGTIRDALPRARERVESPKETETRLLLVDKGLPEPVVQFEAYIDGLFIGRGDLAYPEWKIAIEYEGDGHRTDKNQWRKDIRRQRELEGAGWIVIRLTQADLADGKASLIARIRNAIASRIV